MHVVFRVDASTDIGTGHVMRCLTLANALRHKKHKVSFISRVLQGNLINYISENGFDVLSLDSVATNKPNNSNSIGNTHAEWLPVSWQQDADETIGALADIKPADWLVIDHYALDARWEDSVKQSVTHILVIDDLADRKHSAQLLLDQNYYADMHTRYHDRVTENTRLLIGPEYTLLREEFTNQRDNIKPRDGNIQNLLIFFGGVDTHNLTSLTLEALQQIDIDFVINVIIGSTNPHKDNVLKMCESINSVTAHVDVNNMAQLMQQADLAIGAGGTTTWERCFTGLPAIVITLAHNQKAVNDAVASHGASILAGDTSVTTSEIATHIQQLIDNPGTVTAMSASALAIMHDHVGAHGVVDIMEQHRA